MFPNTVLVAPRYKRQRSVVTRQGTVLHCQEYCFSTGQTPFPSKGVFYTSEDYFHWHRSWQERIPLLLSACIWWLSEICGFIIRSRQDSCINNVLALRYLMHTIINRTRSNEYLFLTRMPEHTHAHVFYWKLSCKLNCLHIECKTCRLLFSLVILVAM
jgi:hypothetical protein